MLPTYVKYKQLIDSYTFSYSSQSMCLLPFTLKLINYNQSCLRNSVTLSLQVYTNQKHFYFGGKSLLTLQGTIKQKLRSTINLDDIVKTNQISMKQGTNECFQCTELNSERVK